MTNVSIGLTRTMVAIVGTFFCGSSLMVAALSPDLSLAPATTIVVSQQA